MSKCLNAVLDYRLVLQRLFNRLERSPKIAHERRVDPLKTLTSLKNTSNAHDLKPSRELPKTQGATREEELGYDAPITRRDRVGETRRIGLRARKTRERRARQRRLRPRRTADRRRGGSLLRSTGARSALLGDWLR